MRRVLVTSSVMMESQLTELAELTKEEFDDKIEKFLRFMFETTAKLPGPKHPNARYYEMRKSTLEYPCAVRNLRLHLFDARLIPDIVRRIIGECGDHGAGRVAG